VGRVVKTRGSSFLLKALSDEGFVGFVRFQDLDLKGVPKVEGVYIVLRTTDGPPTFLKGSPGGWFNGNDPTESVSKLESSWVKGTRVLYIGKASRTKYTDLRKRLRWYRAFGSGKRKAHWGGRYIWQCGDSADYLVCWKDVTGRKARDVESELIARFVSEYGQRPFANIIA